MGTFEWVAEPGHIWHLIYSVTQQGTALVRWRCW